MRLEDTAESLLTRFPDGDYAIGRHIAPGTYTSEMPAEVCAWAIMNDFGYDSMPVEFGLTEGEPATVTVSAHDFGFLSHGCGTWTRRS